MADFVISNDLVVLGMSTFTGGQTFDGQAIIDIDNTEALLVRKDGDSGDVFVIDTVNDLVTIVPTSAQLILPTDNDANTPTLAFGDGDSGFYEQSDDTVQLALAGGTSVRWNTTGVRSLVNGSWTTNHVVASGTVPPYTFQGDTNTGMGKNAADQLSLIAGGVEVLRLSNATEFAQSRWSGAFTSDGSSNLATGALFAADITNASGDTALSQVRMGGTNVGGSLTTSGAGDSLLACTLWLDEPDVTLTPSDAMAAAATLYISGAPTEGTSANYSLFIDNGSARFDGSVDLRANSTFSNPANTFTFGSGVPQTYAHVAIIGAFTSSGISNQAAHLYIAGALTGASGDTVSLAGLRMQNTITTQGASQTITDVAQAIFVEPVITVGSGDTITNASTLVLFGSPTEGTNNFSIRSTGPAPALFTGVQFIIGSSSVVDYVQLHLAGSFTSGGGSTFATGGLFASDITSATGDTLASHLRAGGFGGGSITTPGTGQGLGIATLALDEPNAINAGGGDTISSASTLAILSEPTEGTANYGIFNQATLRQDGFADFRGDTTFSGPTDLITIGSGVLQNNARVFILGAFTSGGAGTESGIFSSEAFHTGASGDTTALFGMKLDNTITTQTATESIANISQLQITNPVINDNLTGDITHAQTLFLNGSPGAGEANWALRSTGAAPSIFAGRQFAIGATSIFDYQQFTIAGSFTSGGGAAQADKFKLQDPLIGASGDIQLVGAFFSATITTQTAAEVVTNVAQVRIGEPSITLGAGSSITDAQTLLITGSPTEGNDNWTLRSTGAAPSVFEGLQFIIGDFALDDYHQVLISGSFTSGGASDRAAKLRVEGVLTGASGDTNSINGAWFDTTIVTQTATESIADISAVRIDEPVITDNLTGDITLAMNLHLVGSPTEGESNFALKSTGPAPTQFGGQQFVIGTNVVPVADFWQVLIRGNFTSGGTSNRAAKFHVEEGLTGASGDTTFLVGADFDSSITTQTAAEVVAEVAQVRIDEPQITLGAGSSITNASSLLIAGAPTEGVTNDALRIVSGSTQFPQGSAAAPSIRFGNVGTGIYQNTTNDVLVTIDGVSLIKVTDAGSVNRLSFHSDLALTWTSGAAEGGGPQFALIREATAESQSSVGDLALSSGADFTVYKERVSSSSYHRTSIRHREETLSNVSGASVTTTITAIPDGALVLGVTTTVEVALGTSNGTTGYQVGDGTDADRWGDITGTSTLTESDDADFTVATVDRFTSSGEVTITAVGGNFDGTGDILVVVHFLEIGANRP